MPAFDVARVREQGNDILFVVVPGLMLLTKGERDGLVAAARNAAVSAAEGASPGGEAVILCTYEISRWHFYGPNHLLPLCEELAPHFVDERINGRLEWQPEQAGQERPPGSEHGDYLLN